MGRPWHPSLADQLEDVADKLLEAAYAVTAIARTAQGEANQKRERWPCNFERPSGWREASAKSR
jgi:hypothetical protein